MRRTGTITKRTDVHSVIRLVAATIDRESEIVLSFRRLARDRVLQRVQIRYHCMAFHRCWFSCRAKYSTSVRISQCLSSPQQPEVQLRPRAGGSEEKLWVETTVDHMAARVVTDLADHQPLSLVVATCCLALFPHSSVDRVSNFSWICV